MDKDIKALILEDEEADADLLCRELKKSRFHFLFQRAESKSGFEKALAEFKPDVILADGALPSFDGMSALRLAREKFPATPFIFVSGSVGEEFVIEALKGGAWDFVLKSHLLRVLPAVERALRDVQDRSRAKLLEEQLFQAQKMEILGRLAGGIAHDFNNLLTAISGYSELLLANLASTDPNRADVEEIKNTVYRATALTRQLLTFSRKQTLKPVVLDLNSVVSGLEKMLLRLIGEDIALKTILDPGLGRVLADSGQIEQAIMNLVVNSRDAMPQGGALALETKNVNLDEQYAQTHVNIKPGRYVRVSVSDTGCGMSPETQSRLFEPFFTTKDKGTGLGLSTVYGIVRQFGGHIDVSSRPGRGTTFNIYFPPVSAALEAAGQTPVPLKALKGSETVLFVDDEESIRRLARRVLESNGYAVIEARDGAEALRLADSQSKGVSLLVTDLVMFGMRGDELARRISQKHRDIKVLFLSGYSEEIIKNGASASAGTAFLQKPFAPNDLLRRVRETLESK